MTAPQPPETPFDAAARRLRDLLGEEGQRLGDHLPRALGVVLEQAEPEARDQFLRRMGQGVPAEQIAREGGARSAGEVEQSVRELVRRVRAEALRATVHRTGEAPSPSSPPAPSLHPSTPETPLPRVDPEPAAGRSPSRSPLRQAPSMSTVEVVRRVRGRRRRWPWGVAAALALALLGWKLGVVGPRQRSAELTHLGIELSEGALTASQIAPLRHPSFGTSPPRGDLREALGALEAAVERDPRNAQAHLALAWLDLAHGMDSAARLQLQEAETYRAPAPAIALGRGIISWRTALAATTDADRDFSLAQADAFFARVRPADPGYREAVHNRVLVARERKDPERARQLAEAYAALAPEDPLGAELLRLARPAREGGAGGGKGGPAGRK